MGVLSKLSLRNLKLNKKRTVGTIVGIILSVALVTAVAGMFESLHATLVSNATAETGYYHYALPGIDTDTYNTVKSNRTVKSIMDIYEMGTGLIEVSNHPHAYLTVRSTNYFDYFPYIVLEGRKPVNQMEVVIPSGLAMDAGIKIGDTIEADFGKRMTEDGYILHEGNPYTDDTKESIVEAVHRKYEVVGIVSGLYCQTNYSYGGEDTSAFYSILTTKDTSSVLNAYVALNDPHDGKTFLSSLYATGKFDTPTKASAETYNIVTNYELLRWEIFAFSDETITMLYTVVGIVLFIIVVTSVFCIRNSFAISTTEKAKMIGMLSSVGATKKQIKKSVLIEAFILGVVGIPLGLLAGVFADFVIVKVVNIILKDFPMGFIGGLVFKVSFMPFVVAVVLGVITIYFSAIKSARKASRISPIDNLRNSKDVVLTAKNMRTPAIIEHVFKTGGVLAYKNLKRSKKKYRTTVISLTVSVFIFIALNSFLTDAFKMTGSYYQDYDYNVSLGSVRRLSQKEIMGIRSLDNVQEFYMVYEVMSSGDDYLKVFDIDRITKIENEVLSCDSHVSSSRECTGREYMQTLLFALDDATFHKYADKIGIDYDRAKDKGILADEVDFTDESGKEHKVRRYDYKKGEIFESQFHDQEFNLEIAAVTQVKPYGLENYGFNGGMMIVNKEYFEDLPLVPYRISIQSDNSEKLVSAINTYKSGLGVVNIDAEQKSNRALSLIVSIFLYGFIAVITAIGVTNIFNTITSNMELRQKEFAMLKSIGMTKTEFSRMINLETLFYSAKSLVYGIAAGLIGAWFIHDAFDMKIETSFQIPWMAIFISICFVFVIVFIIMHFSITKIGKQNTIETIRNENI